ncbi:hypothetical protein ABEB36_003218 [Hypothenemus hampei]|uniref:Uncharacterized protein n=1 Tax=Hypothenemus hampei TaxID=57062 RepID=A0ABD1F8H6_HYPHA
MDLMNSLYQELGMSETPGRRGRGGSFKRKAESVVTLFSQSTHWSSVGLFMDDIYDLDCFMHGGWLIFALAIGSALAGYAESEGHDLGGGTGGGYDLSGGAESFDHGWQGGGGGGGEAIEYHQTPTKHFEHTKAVPVHVVKKVGVPVPHPVGVPVPQVVKVPVPQPYPVHINVPQPIPIPIYKLVPQEIEKKVPIHVEKLVPVYIKKPYKVEIEKHYPVHVNKPYPVHVPVFKHVYHETKHEKYVDHGGHH